MFRFIHAADIHLDSSRSGLHRDGVAAADDIRQAPRQALKNLVSLALEKRVHFVLIAGDLYDQDWRDFRTGLFFVEQMGRLREAGIRVFLIAGNHDAANKMTRTLNLPDHVTMFPADAPATHRLDEIDVAIHGQSFAQAAVTENLALGYPSPEPGLFNIGLLHTCATKSGEHDRYAPCTLEDLRHKQYDYWALGHVHTREILCQDPWIVFPGNLQGRHIRETGPRGCILVTVEDARAASVEFCPVDVLRWERCRIDASSCESPEDVLMLVTQQLRQLEQRHQGLPLAARVEISGQTPAHRQLAAEPQRWEAEIQAAAIPLHDARIWIERVDRRTSEPRVESGLVDGPIGELTQFIHSLREDENALRELSGELADLNAKLPRELAEGRDSLGLDSVERMRELLDDVEPLLIHRLLEQSDAS